MVQRWSSDTCNCVLLINDDYTEMLEWEQKCFTHKAVPDNKLFDEVKKENRKFGFELGSEYTDEEVDEKSIAKMEAKQKNLKAGKVEINKKINTVK